MSRVNHKQTRKILLFDVTQTEAEAIETALQLPDVKAFVLICGTLQSLSASAQKRVLALVADRLAEEKGSTS